MNETPISIKQRKYSSWTLLFFIIVS